MSECFTNDNFDEEVLHADVPVLVDFWAPWCGPCQMMAPMIEELAVELNGKAKIGKVNVEEQSALCERLLIKSVPTVVIVKGGKIVHREPGAKDKDEMRQLLGF